MIIFQILFLLSPAVICVQRNRKSTNPNDEPFLPIHPEYPYNPKLMKRGLEQQQQQPQAISQLTPELYAPKVDARDSYSSSYSQTPYYPSYDTFAKSASTQSSLTASPYYQTSLSSLNTSPYGLLNSYGAPYSSVSTPGNPYGAGASNFAAGPYGNPAGAYPYYYYQPPYPYYPNYYNQLPYPPPPLGYPGAPPKHHGDNEDDDDHDRRREKNKKSGSHKNKLRNSDRDIDDNEYVDGANYIISSAKDLDSESSTHRTPNHYNQIDSESEVHPRTVTLPKATYRLVSVSGQQPEEYNSRPGGYIKVQQLEQLMRQALARLLAQSAAQQANLAQIQQEANHQQSNKDNQQYIAVPNTIAKTGLSYVVNPTILNRVNPGQYNPSQLIQTSTLIGGNKQSYGQKPTTSVSLQQSPGIYIPPSKNGNDQSSPPQYADYDSSDTVTARSQSTVEPAHNSYVYSTYRPTQQTSLEDVNFGNKQKNKT